MTAATMRSFTTPRDGQLGLATATSPSGLYISRLPNGSIFEIGHRGADGAVMINQVLGSPVHGGIGRLLLRTGGSSPLVAEIVGPAARCRIGAAENGFVFEGETEGIRHRAELVLDPEQAAFFWRVEIENGGDSALPFDLVLIQDLGLGGRGFLMGSEAYASQYIDHAPMQHPRFGAIVMSRQNLKQGSRNPWIAIGCLDGGVGYATDAMQLFGPLYRSAGVVDLPFGTVLPGERLQHEVAAPAILSAARELKPGERATISFFALFLPDHPEASGEGDLAQLDPLGERAATLPRLVVATAPAGRSLVQDTPLLRALPMADADITARYPERLEEETATGALLSFFVRDGAQNRHIVLAAKDNLVARRHGAILRSGQGMTLDERTLASTAWMHGVFSAQLTIGNTSFHKLFSVSRDPYGITRGSGLHILVDTGEGWRLLAMPSLFEIGLSDCRWLYRLTDRTIEVQAIASGEGAAMQWSVTVDGPACRFLVFGHLVMGEREYEQSGTVEIDEARLRASFRPGSDWLWGQRYPQATMHLVTSTPEAVEAIGGAELLALGDSADAGGHVVLRSKPTHRLVFAVTGSMTDAAEAERLADAYAGGRSDEDLLAPARLYWSHVTRDANLPGKDAETAAHNLFLPWLAHDAMVHLTVPHGLEQYTGAAWGTRDVCQGPLEFLLALGHDATVREILLTLFAEQDPSTGDWPQWFMLPPYSSIRAGDAHGDILIWPLKALADYIEETGDLSVLEAKVTWRHGGEVKGPAETIRAHVETLLAAAKARFIPGTHLIRYGEGDWNDSLQPHDPHLRDWMVSSWTAGLLHEQVARYGAILSRAGETEHGQDLADLASAIRHDFRQHLVADGVVAGYGLFDPAGGTTQYLLHPSDTRTGLSYSLIAMTQAILGGLLDEAEARHHLALIEKHLAFPDGVRLMDRPVTYRGGPETLFRRAESSSFFGREIGLMYVHAHLRHCEVLAKLGERAKLSAEIARVNPVSVTRHVASASLRQRNSYFSSSDAAFPDRYAASRDWPRAVEGTIAFDGGWRIYSSGPGIFTRLLLRELAGRRRWYGKETGHA
ncbi:cellobiose phosphorylase [Kaistia algarum]|uniref:GH36-type glycosyl hydrolase domain-containing protein n=1 Tax=Kaistia algarum TaxID=2083279 RepID=UPI000CE8EACE|nr:cellobiose phosphorylase [Kaistia algarum]MCX5512657.1 cellobiose phosphorylase [Kaistia algarum]PPE81831.1 cellobiose phosphorylase [Kaistia algarum]